MRDRGVDVNPPQVADQPLAARATSSQASHVRRRSAWTSRTIGSRVPSISRSGGFSASTSFRIAAGAASVQMRPKSRDAPEISHTVEPGI